MNIEYLYSIINLYLGREKDKQKTNLNIRKLSDSIEFNFNMNSKDPNKTTVKIPLDDVKLLLANILNKYKQDLIIIDEDYVKSKDSRNYRVLFKNGRSLSFDGFSLLEINNFRNILYNISVNNNEVLVENINVQRKMEYKPSLVLQQAGFMSNSTIFLVVLYLVDLFLIILWILKVTI